MHIEGDNGEYLYLDEVTDSIDTDTKGVVKIYPKPEANVDKIIAAIKRAQQYMEIEEITDNPNYILCTLPQIDESLKAELENSIDAFFRYVINEMKEIHLIYLNLIASCAEPSRKEELISECKNEYDIKKEEVTSYKNEILQTIEDATNLKLQLNIDVQNELDKYEKKMKDLVDLFTCKCAGILTKTNPIQLLPIVVTVGGENKNIEDVADCSIGSDEYFKIVPKQEDYREAIKVGILQSHPLMQLEDKMDETPAYIRCAMPEVDKNRRDSFDKSLWKFYSDAKKEIKKSFQEFKIKAKYTIRTPEEYQKALEIADDLYNIAMGEMEINYERKRKEMADAYQRYCTTHGLTPETPVVVIQ